MPNTIRLKRRLAGGASGAPSSLSVGEPAYSEVDSILYIGLGSGSVQAIGGTGAFAALTVGNTFSGSNTFTGSVALGSSATASTQSSNDSTTKVATTAFVQSAIAAAGAGSVSSVALSLPSIFTVSGSPVTSSGTLTAALASQTKNYIFAAPTSTAGAPTFRALATSDIPDLSGTYLTAATAASDYLTKSTAGTTYLPLSGGTITSALTVNGNLTVNGTTTTVNSTTTTYDDVAITLGGDTAPTVDDGKDRGVEFRYYAGGAARLGFFGYDNSTGGFAMLTEATNSGETFTGTVGSLAANLAWSYITSKPTTISGYGITDALSSSSTIDGGTF